MLFPFSVSVSALSIGSKIIVGKIITNEQLDISNIKIDIYNSILVNEADGVKEYNNILHIQMNMVNIHLLDLQEVI